MTEVRSNLKNEYESYNCERFEAKDKYNEETQEQIYKCIETK